jgi:hypothetical protein
VGLLYAGEKNSPEKKTKLDLLYEIKKTDNASSESSLLDSRKDKAIIFSALIPGSGQTFLGNTWKGVGFTLAFYGSAITAFLANNNKVAREERITVLTQEYKAAGNFNDADLIWNEILLEKDKRDNDYKRRQIFSYSALGVWVLNLIDIIFFTDDKGGDEFSSINSFNPNFNIISKNQLSYVELKINIP